jgi:AcrR family transcriptional regulator
MGSVRRVPKQTRGEQRIHAILGAAATVFQEYGYDGATTTLIAQRAHTAIGSLYDFFPNKEAIARNLVERFIADLQALYASILTEELARLPLAEMIDRIIDPFIAYQQAHPGFHTLWTTSLEDRQLSSQLSTQRRALDERLVDWTSAVMSLRYPQYDAATARRLSQVCIRTVQGLIQLANAQTNAQQAAGGEVLADLKLMMRAFLEAAAQRSSERSSE